MNAAIAADENENRYKGFWGRCWEIYEAATGKKANREAIMQQLEKEKRVAEAAKTRADWIKKLWMPDTEISNKMLDLRYTLVGKLSTDIGERARDFEVLACANAQFYETAHEVINVFPHLKEAHQLIRWMSQGWRRGNGRMLIQTTGGWIYTKTYGDYLIADLVGRPREAYFQIALNDFEMRAINGNIFAFDDFLPTRVMDTVEGDSRWKGIETTGNGDLKRNIPLHIPMHVFAPVNPAKPGSDDQVSRVENALVSGRKTAIILNSNQIASGELWFRYLQTRWFSRNGVPLAGFHGLEEVVQDVNYVEQNLAGSGVKFMIVGEHFPIPASWDEIRIN